MPGQIPHPMGLGHLIEDVHPLTSLRWILDGEPHATGGVLNMDEGARLAAGAVHGERIADGRLHQEPVQDGAVVAVVVETVDQPLVAPGLIGLGAPDDALMEIGNPQMRRFCCSRRTAAHPGSWSCGRWSPGFAG